MQKNPRAKHWPMAIAGATDFLGASSLLLSAHQMGSRGQAGRKRFFREGQ
jgi:hypothetical protein